jgi:alkyldihydroxyacetonephosphate synthase
MYITYLWRRDSDPMGTLSRWQTLKQSASQVIVELGGTISHQHGVGFDHAKWLAAEKGAIGMATIRSILDHFDPHGLMNPGKMIREGE